VRVKDGAEALDFIFRRGAYAKRAAKLPKLLLLDIKMPKVDGIEVLREVKASAETKSMPVVMLTSSAEEKDIAAATRSAVNSYIVKPVDFVKFVEEVAKAAATGCSQPDTGEAQRARPIAEMPMSRTESC
jgi:CheY-like chemotaxis protein